MNEQNLPNDYNVLTSAEQLVAGLWQTERDEEIIQDSPPPSFEATESEVCEVEAWTTEFVKESVEGFHAYTLTEIDRFDCEESDIVVYAIRGLTTFTCDGCPELHEVPLAFNVMRLRPGATLAPMQVEVILDRHDEIKKKRRETSDPPVIRIHLSEAIGKLVDEVASERAKELMENQGKVEPTALYAQDNENIEPSDTARLPVIDIDEYRVVRHDNENNARPGLLRRAWNWLRKLWRR